MPCESAICNYLIHQVRCFCWLFCCSNNGSTFAFSIRQRCFSGECGSLSFVRMETTIADLRCFLFYFYFLNHKFGFLGLLAMVNLFFLIFQSFSPMRNYFSLKQTNPKTYLTIFLRWILSDNPFNSLYGKLFLFFHFLKLVDALAVIPSTIIDGILS